MTPQQASEIRSRALRQIVRDCVSVHITSRQVEDLACAYLDAERRLAQIAALMPLLLYAWADHDREEELRIMAEIERLCKTAP